MSNSYDFTEIEAAFNAEADEADALVLERWEDMLKRRPVKGDAPELPAESGLDLNAIRAGLKVHHGGPGPHKDGSSQDVHGGDRGASTPTTGKSKDRSRDELRFKSIEEVDAWQQENKDNLFPSNLTKEQIKTLDNYKRSSDWYKPMNSFLRRGSPEDGYYGDWKDEAGLLKGVEIMDSAINSSVIPEDVLVYRGMPSEMIPSNAIGSEFVDKGFGSTSLSLGQGSKFARWVREDGYTPMLVEIKVPKGYKGLAMENLWDNAEEEILLPRNTRYRILSDSTKSIEGYPQEARFLELEVVNE